MPYYKQLTNKLFYGEWPYKICVQLNGAFHLRKYKILEIPNDFLKNIKVFYNLGIRLTDEDVNRLKNFSNILKKYSNKEIKLRHESSRISIYIKNNEHYKDLTQELTEYITHVCEPKDEIDLEKMLENKKYTLCDKLPYGKYRYKISFKDMPPQTKINLMLWVKKYTEDEIKITKATEKYFNAGTRHYGTCYCYVKDKNMALLVSLATQGNVRKTEEFVIRNNIK